MRFFYEAELLRQERMNTKLWLQGMYIYDAIGRLAPALQAFPGKGAKVQNYVDEPYPISRKTQEKQRQLDEEQQSAYARVYMLQMMEAGKNWGKNSNSADT